MGGGYEILEKLNLYDTNKVQIPAQVPKQVPVTNISLNVAQVCNMSCVYCYGGDGEYGGKGYMKQPTAFEAVDWLFTHSLNATDLSIVFFGGEPLLNFNLIKEVVAYSLDKAEKTGKKIYFGITTNGTKFNEEINAFLNQYQFSVTISFDGDAQMQNRNRPMKGGKGSYEVVKDKIETFLKTRNGKASGRATVTDYNTDLEKIRQILHETGFATIGHTMVSAPEQHDFLISSAQYQKILADLEVQAQEVLSEIKSRRNISNSLFKGILNQLVRHQKKLYFCGLGRGLLAVSDKGDIFPCHRFVGDEKMKMGNIANFDPQTQQKYIENTGLSHPKCGGCWARYFCGGGCIHESIMANGKMHEPDDKWCQTLRRSVEFCIVIYDKLNEEDIAFLHQSLGLSKKA